LFKFWKQYVSEFYRKKRTEKTGFNMINNLGQSFDQNLGSVSLKGPIAQKENT